MVSCANFETTTLIFGVSLEILWVSAYPSAIRRSDRRALRESEKKRLCSAPRPPSWARMPACTVGRAVGGNCTRGLDSQNGYIVDGLRIPARALAASQHSWDAGGSVPNPSGVGGCVGEEQPCHFLQLVSE
jgi:hypothetical protein